MLWADVIGLPSRQTDPTFIEFVAVGGNSSISITGMRFTGNVFRSSGAHADAGVLTAFKLNETNGKFDRQQITNSLVEGNSYDAVNLHKQQIAARSLGTPACLCESQHLGN